MGGGRIYRKGRIREARLYGTVRGIYLPPGRPWKTTDNRTCKGYYMAERGYEISASRVEKNISLVRCAHS